jgi:hypothetical protein
MGREIDCDITASFQSTIDRESRRIAGRIVACICNGILSRLFATSACANLRAISDTQPGRERPRDRPWGHGRGFGGGVAHVPAALRDTRRGGKDRRRTVHWSARLDVLKLSQRIRLRARVELQDWARSIRRVIRYSARQGE